MVIIDYYLLMIIGNYWWLSLRIRLKKRRVKKKMKGVKKEKSNENWWKLMIVIENCW